MEGKRRFSRVKLLPCPPQALSPPDTGQTALSPHHRKPSSPYVLENYLFQQIHRVGGFRGQIQQSLALTDQLTKLSDGKRSLKGCLTPLKVKVSPVALKQALTQAGARQRPQKPKQVLGSLPQPMVLARAQVPVLQAGSRTSNNCHKPRVTSTWASPAPSGKLQEFLLGVLRKPPSKSRASQGDTEIPQACQHQ